MTSPLDERRKLLEKLHQKYERAGSFRAHVTYWRKKYSWLFVIGGAKLLKRLIDVAGAMSLFVGLSPLMATVAFLIKTTDGGPVLYISRRVGLHGREFQFPKFRSMVPGAEQHWEKLREESSPEEARFKMRKDPRITWIGAIIRRFSIDELPQLWCVIKGEMSLVGPRPPLPDEVKRYDLTQRKRLEITPGLTCLWQVSGRSEIPFNQQVQLDVEYIESQSLWLDLRILLKTIPAVILGKGAY